MEIGSLQIQSNQDEVKIRAHPNPMAGVLIRRGKFGLRYTLGQYYVKMEVEIRLKGLSANEGVSRTADSHRKEAERKQGRSLP